MINFKKRIEDIYKLQKLSIETSQKFESNRNSLENDLINYIKKELSKAFPHNNIEIDDNIRAGCLCEGWTIKLSINSIDNCLFSDRGYWIKHYQSREKIKAPNINIDELQQFCKRISNELGIIFYLYEYHIKTKDEVDEIRNIDDIKAFYENNKLKIVTKGEVYYKGSEACDNYYILMVDDRYIIYYTFDGFGLRLIKIDKDTIDKDKQLDTFFIFMDKYNSNKKIREKYYNKIVENWNKKNS